MQTTISITNKWQIHIPRALREEIGLNKPGQVVIKAQDDAIIIRPAKSAILQMAGKYEKSAKGKNINLENIRDKIDYGNL